MSSNTVLEVKELCKYFDVKGGIKGKQRVLAVDGISFEVKKGETFGLVGESGCGKSTLGRTILRIYEPTKGKIFFEGQDISGLSRKKMHAYRRKLQMFPGSLRVAESQIYGRGDYRGADGDSPYVYAGKAKAEGAGAAGDCRSEAGPYPQISP